MAHIAIYIARHLCTAPRPQKEATALAAAGHEVSIHGVVFDPDMKARDQALGAGRPWRWAPVVDHTAGSRRGSWWWARCRHRLARRIFRHTRRVSADVWSYSNSRLRAHAFQNPADLTIVHAEGSLWFGREMALKGHCVGVDFEDWFSEDLTAAQRRERPVNLLRELESYFCRTTPYCLTTSRSLSQAMADRFDAPAPHVIYNTFADQPDLPPPRAVEGSVKFHWFSLVIGPHRGLEELFDALGALSGAWTLSLRGQVDPAYRDHLLGRLESNQRSRVTFLPLVSADELPRALQEFDVGLSLETSEIPSRNLTITNKFFHYLQSGLAVVASDTAGNREGLAASPDVGRIFAPGQLEPALAHWVNNPAEVTRAKHAARTLFRTHFAHETQADRYAILAEQALANH